MLPVPCLPAGTTIFEPADNSGPTLLRYLHLIGHDPRDTQHFLSTDCRQPGRQKILHPTVLGARAWRGLPASASHACNAANAFGPGCRHDFCADQEPNLLKTNTIYETELACQSTQYLAFNYSTRKMFFQCAPYPQSKISDSPIPHRARAPAAPAPA